MILKCLINSPLPSGGEGKGEGKKEENSDSLLSDEFFLLE